MSNTINSAPVKSATSLVGHISSVRLTPTNKTPQTFLSEPNVIRAGIVMPSIPDLTARPSVVPVESSQDMNKENGSIDAKE